VLEKAEYSVERIGFEMRIEFGATARGSVNMSQASVIARI